MTVLDLIVVVIVVLTFSICTFFGLTILTAFRNTMDTMNASTQTQTILNTTDTTLKNFDYAFVFLFFGLIVAVIIGAFTIKVHPALFFVSIFVLTFIVILSGQFYNIFYEFTIASELQTAASNFTLMENIWENMPLIIMVTGIVVIIVLYAKIRGGEESVY